MTVATNNREQLDGLLGDGRWGDAIVAYVKQHDWVTFVGLQQFLEPHLPVKGDTAFCLRKDPNIVLWGNVSQEFYGLVSDLITARRLHLHPTQVLTYLIDGGATRLPIAKRPPEAGYREPHWLPMCLRCVPLSGASVTV